MATVDTKGPETWRPFPTRKLQVSLDSHCFLKSSLLLLLFGYVPLSTYIASWLWDRIPSYGGSKEEADVYSTAHYWTDSLHRLAATYFNMARLKTRPLISSFTNIFRCRILGVMPLTALFVLFDFVVHNPYHPESSTNLTFLDVVGAYFTRLEYSTGGSLPSSLVAEFALIARQFVRDIQLGKNNKAAGTITNNQYQPPARETQYDGSFNARDVDQSLMYQQPQMVSQPRSLCSKVDYHLTQSL